MSISSPSSSTARHKYWVYPGFPTLFWGLSVFFVGDLMGKALWKLVENAARFPRRGGYTFIHVMIPHPPYVVDADCSFIGPENPSRPSYADPARCALALVQKLFDRLRALGVWDRTAIVLTSDHGWDELRPDHPLEGVKTPAGDLDEIAVRAMALLAVKPAGSSGPLRTSAAPTAITDVPATILDLMRLPNDRLPGQSALQIDPNLSRRGTYAHHAWRHEDWGRPYLPLLHIFSIDGRITDPNAWTFQAAILRPYR